MLLNLSNHPSTKWSPEQRQAANEDFGGVSDLLFPNIAPEATPDDIWQLAMEYFRLIEIRQPSAVHVMGEMTFTFRLVTMLKAAGMHCVASTTERIVTESEGQKIVQFKFVMFRAY